MVISGALFIFLGGMGVRHFEVFPYPLLKYVKDSAAEVIENRNTLLRVRPDQLLKPARYRGKEVTRNVPGKASPGLTFVLSLYATNEMRLIRLDGSIVQRWPVEFFKIFANANHIQPKDRVPQSEWNTELHGGLVLPDGSIVFNFEDAGLAKLDKCGAVQWALPRMTHHSAERAEDGGFWIPGHRYVSDPALFAPYRDPFPEDTILKISEGGEITEEISLPRLLLANNLSGLLFVRMRSLAIPHNDLTHLNDIEELTREMAPHFPQFAPGDLLISMRELNTIMVVDPKTQRVKWHQTGPWIAQHDPDFQQDGHIIVFSNNDDGTPAGAALGGSTIIEVDPQTGKTQTLYGGSPAQRMYTGIRGKHQRLANGDLLITESEAGRVFEIDGAGEIVWEYINRYDDEKVAIVFGATRYPEDYFTVTDWSCP
jgi:hypothetical protein